MKITDNTPETTMLRRVAKYCTWKLQFNGFLKKKKKNVDYIPEHRNTHTQKLNREAQFITSQLKYK